VKYNGEELQEEQYKYEGKVWGKEYQEETSEYQEEVYEEENSSWYQDNRSDAKGKLGVPGGGGGGGYKAKQYI